MTADNIIHFPTKPAPPDPWEKAQPSLTTRHTPVGEREELWSHPYFGISQLIWATGSHTTPEPPTPSGGAPVAANAGEYQRLRAVV